jgi:hypothetical protein
MGEFTKYDNGDFDDADPNGSRWGWYDDEGWFSGPRMFRDTPDGEREYIDEHIRPTPGIYDRATIQTNALTRFPKDQPLPNPIFNQFSFGPRPIMAEHLDKPFFYSDPNLTYERTPEQIGWTSDINSRNFLPGAYQNRTYQSGVDRLHTLEEEDRRLIPGNMLRLFNTNVPSHPQALGHPGFPQRSNLPGTTWGRPGYNNPRLFGFGEGTWVPGVLGTENEDVMDQPGVDARETLGEYAQTLVHQSVILQGPIQTQMRNDIQYAYANNQGVANEDILNMPVSYNDLADQFPGREVPGTIGEARDLLIRSQYPTWIKMAQAETHRGGEFTDTFNTYYLSYLEALANPPEKNIGAEPYAGARIARFGFTSDDRSMANTSNNLGTGVLDNAASTDSAQSLRSVIQTTQLNSVDAYRYDIDSIARGYNERMPHGIPGMGRGFLTHIQNQRRTLGIDPNATSGPRLYTKPLEDSLRIEEVMMDLGYGGRELDIFMRNNRQRTFIGGSDTDIISRNLLNADLDYYGGKEEEERRRRAMPGVSKTAGSFSPEPVLTGVEARTRGYYDGQRWRRVIDPRYTDPSDLGLHELPDVNVSAGTVSWQTIHRNQNIQFSGGVNHQRMNFLAPEIEDNSGFYYPHEGGETVIPSEFPNRPVGLLADAAEMMPGGLTTRRTISQKSVGSVDLAAGSSTRPATYYASDPTMVDKIEAADRRVPLQSLIHKSLQEGNIPLAGYLVKTARSAHNIGRRAAPYYLLDAEDQLSGNYHPLGATTQGSVLGNAMTAFRNFHSDDYDYYGTDVTARFQMAIAGKMMGPGKIPHKYGTKWSNAKYDVQSKVDPTKTKTIQPNTRQSQRYAEANANLRHYMSSQERGLYEINRQFYAPAEDIYEDGFVVSAQEQDDYIESVRIGLIDEFMNQQRLPAYARQQRAEAPMEKPGLEDIGVKVNVGGKTVMVKEPFHNGPDWSEISLTTYAKAQTLAMRSGGRITGTWHQQPVGRSTNPSQQDIEGLGGIGGMDISYDGQMRAEAPGQGWFRLPFEPNKLPEGWESQEEGGHTYYRPYGGETTARKIDAMAAASAQAQSSIFGTYTDESGKLDLEKLKKAKGWKADYLRYGINAGVWNKENFVNMVESFSPGQRSAFERTYLPFIGEYLHAKTAGVTKDTNYIQSLKPIQAQLGMNFGITVAGKQGWSNPYEVPSNAPPRFSNRSNDPHIDDYTATVDNWPEYQHMISSGDIGLDQYGVPSWNPHDDDFISQQDALDAIGQPAIPMSEPMPGDFDTDNYPSPEDIQTAIFQHYPGPDPMDRPGKLRQTLDYVKAGKNVTVAMPPGSGKTDHIKMNVVGRGGVGVIVSPQSSLNKQLADRLNDEGILAFHLPGHPGYGEDLTEYNRQTGAFMNALRNRNPDQPIVGIMSPEKFVNLKNNRIGNEIAGAVTNVTFDEAQEFYGPSGRYQMAHIKQGVEFLAGSGSPEDISVMFTGGTITGQQEQAIRNEFDTNLVSHPTDLEHIEFQLHSAKRKDFGPLAAKAAAQARGNAMFYADRTAPVEAIHNALQDAGLESQMYHKGKGLSGPLSADQLGDVESQLGQQLINKHTVSSSAALLGINIRGLNDVMGFGSWGASDLAQMGARIRPGGDEPGVFKVFADASEYMRWGAAAKKDVANMTSNSLATALRTMDKRGINANWQEASKQINERMGVALENLGISKWRAGDATQMLQQAGIITTSWVNEKSVTFSDGQTTKFPTQPHMEYGFDLSGDIEERLKRARYRDPITHQEIGFDEYRQRLSEQGDELMAMGTVVAKANATGADPSTQGKYLKNATLAWNKGGLPALQEYADKGIGQDILDDYTDAVAKATKAFLSQSEEVQGTAKAQKIYAQKLNEARDGISGTGVQPIDAYEALQRKATAIGATDAATASGIRAHADDFAEKVQSGDINWNQQPLGQQPGGPNMFRSPGARMLYGAYMARRMWQYTAAPVMQDAYSIADNDYNPMAMMGGGYRSGYYGASLGGERYRQGAGRDWMGRGAYATMGALIDLPAAMSDLPLGVSQSAAGARLGLGIATAGMEMAMPLGMIQGLEGLAAPMFGAAAGIGLGVAGVSLAGGAIDIMRGNEDPVHALTPGNMIRNYNSRLMKNFFNRTTGVAMSDTGQAFLRARENIVDRFMPDAIKDASPAIGDWLANREDDDSFFGTFLRTAGYASGMKEDTLEKNMRGLVGDSIYDYLFPEATNEKWLASEKMAKDIARSTGMAPESMIGLLTPLGRGMPGGVLGSNQRQRDAYSGIYESFYQRATDIGYTAEEYQGKFMSLASQMGIKQGTPEYGVFLSKFAEQGMTVEKLETIESNIARQSMFAGQLYPYMTRGQSMGMVRDHFSLQTQSGAGTLAGAMNMYQTYGGYQNTVAAADYTAGLIDAFGPNKVSAIQSMFVQPMLDAGFDANRAPMQTGRFLNVFGGMNMQDISAYGRMAGGDLSAWSHMSRQNNWGGGQFLDAAGRPIYQSSLGDFQQLVAGQSALGNPYAQMSNVYSALQGEDAEAMAVWQSQGQIGRENLHAERMYQFQQQGIQQSWTQLRAQESHMRTGWGLQDQQRQLQYGSQQADFAYQGWQSRRSNYYQTAGAAIQLERMTRGNEFAIAGENIEEQMMNIRQDMTREGWGRQEQRMRSNNAWQLFSLDFGQETNVMQRGFTKTNWQYDDEMRNLQNNWNLEDINENIRFSHGRQRRLLMQKRERMLTSQNLEEEQISETRDQQEELWERSDEYYEAQKEHILEMQDLEKEEYNQNRENQEELWALQREQFELQKQQREEMFQLSREDFELQEKQREEFYRRERQEQARRQAEYEAQWRIQNQIIAEDRRYQEQQLQFKRDELRLQQQIAQENHAYSEATRKIAQQYNEIAGYMSEIAKNDPTEVIRMIVEMLHTINSTSVYKLESITETLLAVE